LYGSLKEAIRFCIGKEVEAETQVSSAEVLEAMEIRDIPDTDL
jgi:hypothetical protein